MLPIYANCCHGVSIGCVYGFFGAVDNHGISWQKSHKKPNKIHFCRDSEGSAAGHQSNLLRFCRGFEGSAAGHKSTLPRFSASFLQMLLVGASWDSYLSCSLDICHGYPS